MVAENNGEVLNFYILLSAEGHIHFVSIKIKV